MSWRFRLCRFRAYGLKHGFRVGVIALYPLMPFLGPQTHSVLQHSLKIHKSWSTPFLLNLIQSYQNTRVPVLSALILQECRFSSSLHINQFRLASLSWAFFFCAPSLLLFFQGDGCLNTCIMNASLIRMIVRGKTLLGSRQGFLGF